MNHSALLLAQMSAPTSESFFEGFSPDQRFALIVIALSCAALLVLVLGGILAGVYSSLREKQIEADLKRDMLDRGMTIEEILQVIEAAPKSGFDRWLGSWCKK
jgi:hypothetical protein